MQLYMAYTRTVEILILTSTPPSGPHAAYVYAQWEKLKTAKEIEINKFQFLINNCRVWFLLFARARSLNRTNEDAEGICQLWPVTTIMHLQLRRLAYKYAYYSCNKYVKNRQTHAFMHADGLVQSFSVRRS